MTKYDALSLVTGGANGRGEHIKSLMTDVTYTPKAEAHKSLNNVAHQFPCADVNREGMADTHARPASGWPK